MSAVTEHPEVPVGPDEALAVVGVQRSALPKRYEIKATPLLTAWGLVWLVGCVVLALYREADYSLPTAPYLFFCGCLTAALPFIFAHIAPKTCGIRGRSSRKGTYYDLAWSLGMPLGAVILSRVNAPLGILNTSEVNEVMSVVSNVVPCFVVGATSFMSAVLWDKAVMGALGDWILLATLVTMVVGMPWAWWTMFVAGRGGMLVAAVVAATVESKRGA